MPQYAKFLKEIITSKRRWEDDQTVSLTEKCTSIITSKMPAKLKDPGSFTIPCVVGSIEFPNCLYDLGASINLMPLSIFRKLGLGEVKPTLMTLQLADHSIKKPHGVVEDVHVKVDKFIFPMDFVVLDFEEDRKALVDMYEGKLILRIGDDKVEFNMSKAMKHPMEEELCMRIDVIDSCVKEVCQVSEVEQDFEDDATDGNTCDTEPFAKPELLVRSVNPTPPSIEQPPKLDLKLLPSHLRFGLHRCQNHARRPIRREAPVRWRRPAQFSMQ
ncbi:PREDICTED: uncharacterized protein LOC104590540 [Nelumbo nucifera]|uniref:Uncharacterized protein LOC104590540 n=1 Tax=Nelumbo nucifera TaxID=4432 RepID=A0A1U7Z321_NELNU|nr:PREDICTED: uncharacterized protein LOC104590540 [Nelumbo nucifera]